MTGLSAGKTWLLPLLMTCLFFSCKKEAKQQKRAFNLTTETWYRICPAQPQWLSINGANYLGIFYFPGGGQGQATHLGNCTVFFNQLAYIQPPDNNIAGSVAAPLTDIPSYPVAGDFTELSSAITTLGIPEKVDGKIVNSVIYNKQGEAIFLSAIAGSGSNFPISPTRIGYKGKGLIVGGSGRFVNATGEFDFDGYFNPENNNDATYNAKGWIDY